jgi:TatD DNase family protein
LLIETDAPYLAPHPNRGKLNHSGYLAFVLSTLAQIWNCSPDEAAEQTYQNAKTFFNLP